MTWNYITRDTQCSIKSARASEVAYAEERVHLDQKWQKILFPAAPNAFTAASKFKSYCSQTTMPYTVAGDCVVLFCKRVTQNLQEMGNFWGRIMISCGRHISSLPEPVGRTKGPVKENGGWCVCVVGGLLGWGETHLSCRVGKGGRVRLEYVFTLAESHRSFLTCHNGPVWISYCTQVWIPLTTWGRSTCVSLRPQDINYPRCLVYRLALQ